MRLVLVLDLEYVSYAFSVFFLTWCMFYMRLVLVLELEYVSYALSAGFCSRTCFLFV